MVPALLGDIPCPGVPEPFALAGRFVPMLEGSSSVPLSPTLPVPPQCCPHCTHRRCCLSMAPRGPPSGDGGNGSGQDAQKRGHPKTPQRSSPHGAHRTPYILCIPYIPNHTSHVLPKPQPRSHISSHGILLLAASPPQPDIAAPKNKTCGF